MIAELVRRAARRYVAGDTVEDAAARADALAGAGYGSTLCYWDDGTEDPAAVAHEYARALEAARSLDGYVSVKATAVQFSEPLLEPLLGRGVRLHFDAMMPETVDRTAALVERLACLPGAELGVTLPARWERSDADADRAAELGLAVRIVKGMWAGPDERDPRAGFLALADRLAGSAAFVGVATHDRKLGIEALARLRAAGTPCELEQLYGLPRAAAPARVYVPYGTAWLPYALSRLRPRPRTAWWLARDLVLSRLLARPPARAGA